jgi:hypothetical protein
VHNLQSCFVHHPVKHFAQACKREHSRACLKKLWEEKVKNRKSIGFASILVFSLISSPLMAQSADGSAYRPPKNFWDPDDGPHISPKDSRPFRAARWWQWALGQPANENPLTDTTGEFCDRGQLGTIWFLAGSFGSKPVSRICTVPAGYSLFFPVINKLSAAFLNDAPETRTPKYARAAVTCTIPDVRVQIDGVYINNARQSYLSADESLIFVIRFPPGNILEEGPADIPQLLTYPSATSGIYLDIPPLNPGEHKLHWTASQKCPDGSSSQDITYHLTVAQPPPAPAAARIAPIVKSFPFHN